MVCTINSLTQPVHTSLYTLLCIIHCVYFTAYFTAYFTGCALHCILHGVRTSHAHSVCSTLSLYSFIPATTNPYYLRHVLPATCASKNTYITFLRHVLHQHLHHFPATCASTNTYVTFLRHVLQQTLTSLSSDMCFNTFLRQHFPPACASTNTYISISQTLTCTQADIHNHTLLHTHPDLLNHVFS